MKCAALSIVVLAACSGDPDGPVVDGHGAVTVNVTWLERPIAGATVVLHGPAGDVLATTTTDATGTARGELDTPGMVTVVDPDATSRLVTVTHVRAGETIEIELGLQRAVDPGPQVGTLTVTAPTTSPPAGTAEFAIQTPCGAITTDSFPATVPLYASCTGVSVPVVVLAMEPAGSLEDPGHNLGYVAGSVDAGGTFAPGAWSTACDQVDIRIDHTMGLAVWPRFGGSVFPYLQPQFCALAAAAAGYTAHPVLDFGEGGLARGFAYLSTSLRTATWLADYPSLPAALDLSQTDLLLGDVELTRLDAVGAAWTRDGLLAGTDLLVADLTWSLSASESVWVSWRFIAPGNTTAIVLPELPATVRTWSLDHPTSRTAELRFLAASWTNDLGVLHRQLATLDRYRLPVTTPPATLLGYGEKFYPDAGN